MSGPVAHLVGGNYSFGFFGLPANLKAVESLLNLPRVRKADKCSARVAQW